MVVNKNDFVDHKGRGSETTAINHVYEEADIKHKDQEGHNYHYDNNPAYTSVSFSQCQHEL